METFKQIRRLGIVMKKRVGLFKYNVQMKKQMGIYNPETEQAMMEKQTRQLNMFDFRNTSDVFLLDQYTDASEFGGESDCAIEQIMEDDQRFCKQQWSYYV